MRAMVVAFWLVTAAAAAAPGAPIGQGAQSAHAAGTCGSLGPGTGLRNGRGWIVSMLPGRHEFRMSGRGSAFLTVARLTSIDFDAGRPYYIVLEDAVPGSELEWKTPGGHWSRVDKAFLYPPQDALPPGARS